MTASLLASSFSSGRLSAPSRVVFGPHETNLGIGRALSERHVAYYARRARFGAGVIVTEAASVTANDWPYERAPLAELAASGWRSVAAACAPHSTVVLAGLGHAGGQGSSAYSQEVMWAPSPVADVVTREPPARLDDEGVETVVAAFARAASLAMESGMAGVELDAGPFSLIRQFHSGLTNLRDDRWGVDRLLFTRRVLAAVRAAAGPDAIVALRLSCDELAPWAGVTPEQAATAVDALASDLDLLTVVRGGPFSTGAYRPDGHTPAGFNRQLCRAMREAAAGRVPVVLQGSVVDPAMAEEALADGTCDLVEMTRALIADAAMPARVRQGRTDLVRPCILCNQACRVRDPRNPVVSCVVDPASGHETEEPFEPGAGGDGSPVLIVGAGPAGLECARILAEGGRSVRVLERSANAGGALSRAAHGAGRSQLRAVTDWLAAEAARLGVELVLGTEATAADVAAARAEGWSVVVATGSRPMPDRYPGAATPVVDALSALEGPDTLPDGPVVVIDTVGDAVAVNLAELLAGTGRQVTLVSPDPVAGTLLARTGDLADANGRLQRAGVERRLRSRVTTIGPGRVEVEDAWSGERSELPAGVVVDCGHRLPDDSLYFEAADPALTRVGDCVAPRTALEAVLEGRRAALGLMAPSPSPTGSHR